MSTAPACQESATFAGAVRGLGAGEVARIRLDPEAVGAIVEREIQDRRNAAAEYSALGRREEAAVLTLQIELLSSLMSRAE